MLKKIGTIVIASIVLVSIAFAQDQRQASPQKLAAEIEVELDRNLNLWYPRSVDWKRGGFHTTLARDWSVKQSPQKGVVHQSRMTWTAAEVAIRRSEWKEKMLPIVQHGTKFLRERLWDEQCGGFYWAIADDGTPPPANDEMKHAYGVSFGIYALATAYELTHDGADLATAKQAFYWLDRFGHDPHYGGYVEAFYRDGRPMLTSPENRPEMVRGKTGELFGCKSMNTHIHLLESFTVLYKVWPDETLRSRLEELLLIVRDRITTWPGAMRQFFQADWTPAATYVSFGHDVETAFLMEEAAAALGRPDDPATLAVAKSLVDHSLEFGWDKTHGGFYHEGATYGKPHDTSKHWWVQAEGLNTLLLMHHRYGETNTNYYNCFVQQWNFIAKHQLDPEFGGWYNVVEAAGSAPRETDKSHLWKTSYHECRALLNVAEMLKKL